MTVEDRRRGAHCWQELRTLADIRASCTGKTLMSTLSVYVRLTEVAALKWKEGGRDGFVEIRKVLAAGAGVSPNTLDAAVLRLKELGLVEVEERREGTLKLPSRYILTDPVEIAQVVQNTQSKQEISRAGEPVLLDVDNNNARGSSAKKAEFEEWMEHHVRVTGNRKMTTPGTDARKKVEQSFHRRRREYPDFDLKLLSIAAMRNEHRRVNGYTDMESVLRPSAVEKLKAASTGQAPAGAPAQAPSRRINDELSRVLAEEGTE